MDDAAPQKTSRLIPLRNALGKTETLGHRAHRLGRMASMGLSVPDGVVLPPELVREIADGGPIPDLPDGIGPVVALRASVGERRWGGPQSILNVGLCDAVLPELSDRIGEAGAREAYLRAIRSYAVRVGGLDPEDFENLYYDQMKLSRILEAGDLEEIVASSMALFEDELERPFPQTLSAQLEGTLRSMAREWDAPTARILREASGAPKDAGLAIVVQKMVYGLGSHRSGAGSYQGVDSSTGARVATGRYLPDAQGADAGRGVRTPHMISEQGRQEAGQTRASLETLEPTVFAGLEAAEKALEKAGEDAYELQFTVESGTLWLLDAEPVRRSSRAAVRIAVDLARAGSISKESAVLQIDPRALTETLHPQIDPNATRDVFGTGLPASPGAVTGNIYFSPVAAMAAHAQGESTILVRIETSPEDIRGMHSAAGVLTVRGGMTSHAAVIARGLGLPCVVGASDLSLNLRKGILKTSDGRTFRQGDVITLDGSSGEAMAGAPAMMPAVPTEALDALMDWADELRELGVRANADTPADAALAKHFKVDGIGLCRTEHMFFDEDRINLMREMILADTLEARVSALDRLLPMQRQGFADLFESMEGLPVTIRLLDPPLHEFLPHSVEEMTALAKSMNMAVEDVTARADDLHEFNPMLGKRGVRLGITMPEIYDMQARAIFEAAYEVVHEKGIPVHPEIMIPLVSANREVELVKARVDAVATAVAAERGAMVPYEIGVMVETPRGALRSGDLAKSAGFLSFGTNDLTQMTYGLSRDDAGRFMRDYVNLGVFAEDPFHSLDLEGVGELLLIAAKRGRESNPNLTLGLCGEHGGDPVSIRFCKVAGFDYVSCSPFRVPIARLAAAQATILMRRGTITPEVPVVAW